ncbi:chromate resistance protein [Rubrobacter marinus]|uniref:Chromate resistance protein n=1 Tax=Rubrobacter marinus TaxID=2653852 RepID=A0A6G8Q048_9ACTN|nr:Chromate resistance protein ChrB [Rubrobacter marinus]QIN79841.1 chromate resistance protein [Rubrobacter marinus]
MDSAVGRGAGARWLLLVYRLPREPSRHRVAVWRKLKALGAMYLQDGAAVLPENDLTREQLEWLQLRVREAGGEATLWEATPNTTAEREGLEEAFRASREEVYAEIVEAAGRLRRKAELGGDSDGMLEELKKLERDFRAERRRDYFRSPRREEAAEALRGARRVLVDGASSRGGAGVGEVS